ncbi:MAG TPA: hypothetical protein VMF89_33910, partial [Polyangiales bacterium]|nr:hypothetical protein [Polyangiales bacterium]
MMTCDVKRAAGAVVWMLLASACAGATQSASSDGAPQVASCPPGQTCAPTAPPTAAAPGAGTSAPVTASGAGSMAATVTTQATAGTSAPAAASGGQAPVAPVAAGSGATQSAEAPKGGTWRMMGYDETNTYFNPHETILSVSNAPMLKEKWRFTVAGFPPGSPVVAEGKVFVM